MYEYALIPGTGHFIISDNYEEVSEFLLKDQIEVGRTTLKVGEETDLDGYFNKGKVKFAGYIKNTGSEVLYFYYGNESDMFGDKHYFQLIFRISKSRIFIGFHNDGGRDFNFINGKWDWERGSSKIKNCNIGTEPKEEKHE